MRKNSFEKSIFREYTNRFLKVLLISFFVIFRYPFDVQSAALRFIINFLTTKPLKS